MRRIPKISLPRECCLCPSLLHLTPHSSSSCCPPISFATPLITCQYDSSVAYSSAIAAHKYLLQLSVSIWQIHSSPGRRPKEPPTHTPYIWWASSTNQITHCDLSITTGLSPHLQDHSHAFLTDAFCIVTDGRRNRVCYSLYLLSNGHLNRYIHPDGPNSTLPQIRRSLCVLLLDLPTRAACKLLRSSARSMDSTDFFGIKPSQLTAPIIPEWRGGTEQVEDTVESNVTPAIC